MSTLLDPHAWLWWVAADPRLSRSAKSTIERARRRDALRLSMTSVWEIAKKVEKNQLVLDRPLDQWLEAAIAADGLRVRELTPPVLIESCRLSGSFHGDPADQMIVATARLHGATLVTKDERIRNYEHVDTVW